MFEQWDVKEELNLKLKAFIVLWYLMNFECLLSYSLFTVFRFTRTRNWRALGNPSAVLAQQFESNPAVFGNHIRTSAERTSLLHKASSALSCSLMCWEVPWWTDVGASDGWNTKLSNRAHRDASVLSIDEHAENFESLWRCLQQRSQGSRIGSGERNNSHKATCQERRR